MILKELVGHTVTVTLCAAIPVSVKARLKECDATFIRLDQGNAKPDLFVPLTSILHIAAVQSA